MEARPRMDGRLLRAAVLAAALSSIAASYRTPNFVVTAPTAEIAHQVGASAEQFRQDLAVQWLGKTMPNWSQPCPIRVQVGEHLGAGGATSFVFNDGEVFGWEMNIQGSLARILDSVLPHEVTHTIFASHFRRPLPRWADEGGSTTVEHPSERVKQQKMLISFLRTGRGIPFSQMFAMKDYPADILPLYAQGHSLSSFLLSQGGRQKFMNFVAAGMEEDRWVEVTAKFYGYESLGKLQSAWLDWVRQGSPPIDASDHDPRAIAQAGAPKPRPDSNLVVRAQSADPPRAVVPIGARPKPEPAPEMAAAGITASTTTAKEGWYPSASRPADTAAAPTAVAAAEPARPQPGARRRQVILEWSRAEERTGQPSGGVPAAIDGAGPAASVYDARISQPGILRR